MQKKQTTVADTLRLFAVAVKYLVNGSGWTCRQIADRLAGFTRNPKANRAGEAYSGWTVHRQSGPNIYKGFFKSGANGVA